jgi:hypothetical protein
MISFMIACKRFFGMQKDQSVHGFAEEVRKLTEADKKDMKVDLEKALGEEIETWY